MSYDIVFIVIAQEDLRAIKQYICNDNYDKAEEIVKYILEIVEVLKNNPSESRWGRMLRTRELVISKYPYILPYWVRENKVYILRVLHTSRKWE